ncbi:MAG: AmmeMemoRadiSam system protein B [Thermoguttaceae bacterium]|jgi:AmmeMemoRadiSam system protein A
MNTFCRWIVTLGIIFALTGCSQQPAQSQTQSQAQATAGQKKSPEKIRGPAVAGLFYPKAETDLTKQIDEFLAEAKPEPIKNLRALICPHAGYEYSGKIAASAYKQLSGRDFDTVIVLGPSHYAAFDGAALTEADAYETPLGLIPISPKNAELAKIKPFAINPPCEVERPSFWRQSPKQLPAFGEDKPDTWEHSLEVQLPFLQRTLKKFSIVPVVYGNVDPEAAAKVLLKFIDDRTLVVVSSDLSHYHPYEVAKKLDTSCVRSICDLSTEWMMQQEACGKAPILTLMEIARQKGWKAKLLDYRNSGDTSGSKDRVVGYAAIAFYQPDAKETASTEKSRPTEGQEFSAGERKFLLELARKTITRVTNGENPPEVDAAAVSENLRSSRACFVTLTKNNDLRGCIGSIFPEEPLCQAVISRARAAALEDPRFKPVRSEELKDIQIEISVLTVPRRLEFKSPEDLMQKLRPGTDGVVLRMGLRQATFLPQVWEQLPDKEDFLDHLAQKAGLSASTWREQGTSVLIYQVEAFKESK